MKTKIRLVRSLVIPIALYGIKTCIFKNRYRDNLDVFETCYWIAKHIKNISFIQLQGLSVSEKLTICGIISYFDHIANNNIDNFEKLVVTGTLEEKTVSQKMSRSNQRTDGISL